MFLTLTWETFFSSLWQRAGGFKSFFSKKLDDTQKLHFTFDRELLAAYLAVRHCTTTAAAQLPGGIH
jgi:hypothetical protein